MGRSTRPSTRPRPRWRRRRARRRRSSRGGRPPRGCGSHRNSGRSRPGMWPRGWRKSSRACGTPRRRTRLRTTAPRPTWTDW
ncbi:hypothetical protein DTL70_28545 [Streptomyces diacarni]|uniref:Uncharacterized protein n=1 Tax=Streptomyces diacarni TaxID=2800381 RepID=A0A367EHE9_9ACTN|nr:hypothetical protein DTL70_28545 [Streptomyces diacarni]